MATPISYTLLEPDKYDAVAQDHQPREARYRVTYDDGTTAEEPQMLYWNGANVRSATMAEWGSTAQAEIAEGNKRTAQRAQFQADARAHVGKKAKQLTLPEIRDLFLLYLERDGFVDSDGNLTERREMK